MKKRLTRIEHLEDIEAIFREQLQSYFVSKEKLETHLARANEQVAEKQAALVTHEGQLEGVKSEMQKVYALYTTGQISAEGFGKLYRPLEERERQLAESLPRLEAELDALRIDELSADEVITEATNLYGSWPQLSHEEKRRLIESITEKIVVTKDSVDISLAALPSSEELTKRQRSLCAALPYCDRLLHVSRSDVLPLRHRGIPVPKEPKTVGEHLRRRRLQLHIFQAEAAKMLGVSMVTLSRWECDRIYPTWEFHEAIIIYLGYDPFVNAPHPELQNIQGNEPEGVANLSPAERIGLAIKRCRLLQKLTGKQCAEGLGVDAKTLRDWERGKHCPIGHLRERVRAFVGYDLF